MAVRIPYGCKTASSYQRIEYEERTLQRNGYAMKGKEGKGVDMRMGQMVVSGICLLFSGSGAAEANQYFEGSYEEAQREAQRQGQNMLVKIYADWCGPCNRLQAQVFDQSAGKELTKGLLLARANFDDPKQQVHMKKWKVLNLPTVLFLRPDGIEIGRVEGFEDKASFLASARTLATGQDQLPRLMRSWKKSKRGSEKEIKLRVEVGHRKLVRGNTVEGLSLLESVIVDDPTGRLGGAEEALFLVGRYYSRVLKNHDEGRHLWRTLYLHFQGGRYENTAAWWYAADLEKLGRGAEALGFLENRVLADPQSESALWSLVEFEAKQGQFRKRTRALIQSAKISKTQRSEIELFIAETQKKKD
jgi:thiol-disulfide isomerase/thioredoxin